MKVVPTVRRTLVALTLGSAAPALAQGPVELDELVVSATRLPTDTTRLPMAVTVLQGRVLRARGVRFLADALAEVPSLAVVPTGSWGGVTSLYLRGGESDYVKVLVDGVPLNTPGGYVDLGTVTLEDVERIEVVRGPGSVVHGSDAVTGVVQVFTRRGVAGTEAGGGVSAGSHATRTADAWIRTGGQAWTAAVNAARASTDGTQPFNSAFSRTAIGARVDARPGPGIDLGGGIRAVDHTSAFPTDFAGTPVDSNQRNTGRTLQLDLHARRRAGRLTAALFVGYRDTEAGFENAPDSPGDTLGFGYAARRTRDERRLLADLRLAGRAVGERVNLVAGVALDREREAQEGTSTSNFGDGSFEGADVPFDESRTTLGWYAEAAWLPTDRLHLQAGLRIDDSDAFGGFTTWRTGASFLFGTGTRLTVALGTAFKAPALAETFADSPFERGNRALVPERSRSREVGLRQGVAGGRVVLEARWFDQAFRELIQYFMSDPDGPTYFNLAEASARGLELEARVRVSDRTHMTLGYTRLRTEVVEGGPEAGGGAFVEGERLLRRPAHQASLGVEVRPAVPLLLGATARYLGERDDLDFRPFPSERVTLPSVAVTDLHAAWTLHSVRGLTLTGRVENALGARYETVVGYPARGRVLLVGARLGP